MSLLAQLEGPITDIVIIDTIVDSILDIKGQNIIKIDLKKITDSSSDYFIICEGESVVKINSIVNNVMKRLKNELGLKPTHAEGGPGSKWALINYHNIVVHIFYPETRSFYDLEGLWADGEFTTVES